MFSSPSLLPPRFSPSAGPRASPRVVRPTRFVVHERPRNAATFRALGASLLAERLCSDVSPWR
eukprot:4252748-Prymnesium_polylepis.1